MRCLCCNYYYFFIILNSECDEGSLSPNKIFFSNNTFRLVKTLRFFNIESWKMWEFSPDGTLFVSFFWYYQQFFQYWKTSRQQIRSYVGFIFVDFRVAPIIQTEKKKNTSNTCNVISLSSSNRNRFFDFFPLFSVCKLNDLMSRYFPAFRLQQRSIHTYGMSRFSVFV